MKIALVTVAGALLLAGCDSGDRSTDTSDVDGDTQPTVDPHYGPLIDEGNGFGVDSFTLLLKDGRSVTCVESWGDGIALDCDWDNASATPEG